ncbi:unnamed protein product [Aphanomyces euteiches]|uniref:Uncharacterized protein n=1 Tax=Aphanomyces euteiches TaxID=100861 RepID=A0A6G0XEY2_9STRA|nr:hypothetical protein Ae201684_005563 [Aphanomyces euteiches]KAH9078574.1 hypothetical protein Ae201684P_019655 [Aphanomyces euteiches]KAH9140465.1 hypothetical protein AeRB84_015309 [Aphanomyces euteiches]
MTSPQFQPMYAIAAFGKLHPRKRAVRVVSKRMCSNCLAIEAQDLKPLRPHHAKSFIVCERCYKSPLFHKIRYDDEVSYYGVKRYCSHCHRRQSREIPPLERANGTHLVCRTCSWLPKFSEIRHKQAASQYGLTRKQFESIPSRIQGSYRRRYILEDVHNLAIRLQLISDTN